MTVLAIIPCLNEAANLDRLLTQMLGDPAIDMLVVADGGSTDGSCDIVQRFAADNPRINLINNPARIQSAGVNLAVKQFGSGYDWILRIDAHCSYPDRWASILLNAAEAQQARSVVVPMETRGKQGFQLAAAAAQNSFLGTGGSAHRHVTKGAYVDHGHHALMDRACFVRLGGYCEAMPCNEDAEFDRRLTQDGGRIWLEPLAAIGYFPRETPSALWRQYYRYGKGRARTVRRHKMPMRLRQLVPLAVPLAALLACLAPIHSIFGLPIASWLLVCLGAGVFVGLSAGGGWALAAGLAAAIMHASWACGFVAEWLNGASAAKPRYGLSAN